MDSGYIPFRNFIPEDLEKANDPSRPHLLSSVLYPVLGDKQGYLEEFGQINLMNESGFVHWARERSVPVHGVVLETDIETFWRKGWLRVDKAEKVASSRRRLQIEPVDVLERDHPLGTKIRSAGRGYRYDLHIHPFRLFPLLGILRIMRWSLSRASVLYGKGVLEHANRHVTWVNSHLRSSRFSKQVDEWNGVADLAILLEPLYWPKITGRRVDRSSSWLDPEGGQERQERLSEDRKAVLDLARSIPKAMLAGAHMDLRYQASQVDNNPELYLILRASNWQRRERVKGDIGCALWLRHMAEVIRLAFDELYEDRLVHEDEAGSQWVQGAREWSYGSEYPLDDPQEMVRRILPRYGIASSPRVRFYVEGDTEEGALEEVLHRYLGYGIEIVNLKSKGWDDWLPLQLQKDVDAHRISLVMLDNDRQDHVNAIRRRVNENRIVGMVFVNTPDIEKGNFSVEQLIRAAHLYEANMGWKDLPALDVSNFGNVESGKAFEATYKHLRCSRGLKGNQWGHALMCIAYDDREDDADESNQLVYAVACALRAVATDYVASKRMYRIDPLTLKTVETGTPPF